MSNFYNEDNTIPNEDVVDKKDLYTPNETFSEIIQDISTVKDYLSITQDDTYDDNLLYIIMDSASCFILDYTQLKIEELDKHYQSSLIFLLIVSELYNNRTISLSTGTNGIYNKLLDKMLINLKNDWL